jgi:hypothetical protein
VRQREGKLQGRTGYGWRVGGHAGLRRWVLARAWGKARNKNAVWDRVGSCGFVRSMSRARRRAVCGEAYLRVVLERFRRSLLR